MILLVSGATATSRRYRRVGELIVPGAGNSPDSLRLEPGRWAMDNGAYSGLDIAAFMAMLERFHGRKGCRFVAAPDRVGDAYETLRQWAFWSRVIRGAGFVPALVAQDGMVIGDLPWSEMGALFIGGYTEWKLGPHAAALVAYANARGLWVHMGRVNSKTRIWEAARMGCHSYDGRNWSIAPDAHIPQGLQWTHDAATRHELPFS